LKSCSGDFILQHLILRTRSCGTGFMTQSSWVLHIHPTIMVGWKCFVPPRYQLRSRVSGGPALTYFGMIHTVGRNLPACGEKRNKTSCFKLMTDQQSWLLCNLLVRMPSSPHIFIYIYTVKPVYICVCVRSSHFICLVPY